ncbi:peroxisomal biogenesis factor 3 [Polistes fuscatus]|uniref:peroxisomal biogenesis factor 3 n=1 Tax=Polistes fuscatus TaxID=30207 RepID=UPI001CA92737|nr:peroxisomal biogenesis factor 3 [Polistes fuscatus]
MFSRVREFFGRHKRKFIYGGIIVGSFIFLSRYTQRKLREWQEKEIKLMLEKTRRRQYFESTERTCNQMILNLASNLRESVTKALDTTAIVNKLRNGCNDKVASWNELKVLAISRSAAIIYSHVMFVVLIRIQFNIIAGHMYKESPKAADNIKENEELQTKYMSLCHHFICEGTQKLCDIIKEKVIEITASISLMDQLSLRDLEQIYWSIMSSVTADSRNPTENLSTYMLPSQCEEEMNESLSKIISATLDLLESEEIQEFMQSNIRSGFVLLMDHISEFFNTKTNNENSTRNGVSIPGTSNRKDMLWTNSISKHSDSNFVNINKITMPMAKLIPIINERIPDQPKSKDVSRVWLQRLILNAELKLFGANIFEAFSF